MMHNERMLERLMMLIGGCDHWLERGQIDVTAVLLFLQSRDGNYIKREAGGEDYTTVAVDAHRRYRRCLGSHLHSKLCDSVRILILPASHSYALRNCYFTWMHCNFGDGATVPARSHLRTTFSSIHIYSERNLTLVTCRFD